MAVEIRFSNVIILKSAIASKYPGGLDAFAATEIPNYIEDANLVRVGFMSTGESIILTEELVKYGLVFNDTNQSEIGIVQSNSCPCWLTAGAVGETIACWLSGTKPGPIVKIKNCFLLRCPRILYERLEEVVAVKNIKAFRTQPRREESDSLNAVIEFSRGESFISVDVIGEAGIKKPVCLWGRRDFKRRQQSSNDIKFLQEIEKLLREFGANNL